MQNSARDNKRTRTSSISGINNNDDEVDDEEDEDRNEDATLTMRCDVCDVDVDDEANNDDNVGYVDDKIDAS